MGQLDRRYPAVGGSYRPHDDERINLVRFRDDIDRLLGELNELRSSATHEENQYSSRVITLDLISSVRSIRQRFFQADLFADPAWDMLIELKRAEINQLRVTVSDLCKFSGVPETTALRWIAILMSRAMLLKSDDPLDGRRKFVSLHPEISAAMDRFLEAATLQMHTKPEALID